MHKINRLKDTVKIVITRIERFLADTTDIKKFECKPIISQFEKTKTQKAFKVNCQKIREQYFDIQYISAQQLQEIKLISTVLMRDSNMWK